MFETNTVTEELTSTNAKSVTTLKEDDKRPKNPAFPFVFSCQLPK
jgi:hypothetical protein